MAQARKTVDRFYELFAAGKMPEATGLFDAACVTLMPGGALTQPEHEAMGEAFKAALPDARMVIEHAVEAADEVVVLGHFRGTHTGDFQSPNGTLPASGNELNLRFIDYFKVSDGRIVDHQTVFDQMELLTQLGAMAPA
jgi:predicted ester cyclase